MPNRLRKFLSLTRIIRNLSFMFPCDLLAIQQNSRKVQHIQLIVPKMAKSLLDNSCDLDPTLAFMAEAIREARSGLAEGGVPIGCVIVRNGQVIAGGHNRRIQRDSVILHAEMDCIENAGRQAATFYKECTIYTTLSPCAMCTGAIRLYGIPRVVIGESQNFCGDETLLREHHVQVDVLNSIECQELLADYIDKNRSTWYEDIEKSIFYGVTEEVTGPV